MRTSFGVKRLLRVTFLRYIPRIRDSSTYTGSFRSTQKTIFSIGSLKKRTNPQTEDTNCRISLFFLHIRCFPTMTLDISLLLFSPTVRVQLFKHTALKESNGILTFWCNTVQLRQYLKDFRHIKKPNLILSCPSASWNTSKEGSFQIKQWRKAVTKCFTRDSCQRLTLQKRLPISWALKILLQVF